MLRTDWIKESGFLETPIMITYTNSVGVLRDAVLKWYVDTELKPLRNTIASKNNLLLQHV